MKNIIRKTALASAVAMAFGLSSMAMADSDTFNVTATVEGACSLTAGNNLEFGNYNPVTGAEVTGTTTIAVTCSNGLEGTEVGLAYTGTMLDGSNELNYGLFQDAGHSTVWGSEGTEQQAVLATGTSQEMTVYGRIDDNQPTVAVGDGYTETVTATVSW